MHTQVAVIGGGPSGLRAAELLAQSGLQVSLFEKTRSCGRKFLIAGKSGLNLTHSEPLQGFVKRYASEGESSLNWSQLLEGFSPEQLRIWAKNLGVETFQASSGRVYPQSMKAGMLLRRWLDRLNELGVKRFTEHQWLELEKHTPYKLHFKSQEMISADAVIFALGGASWMQTGSDGSWQKTFQALGITCHPLASANCGWEYDWDDLVLKTAEGKPLKNISVQAGSQSISGELLITRYGLEGGAIYALGRALRQLDQPVIYIDLKPTFSVQELVKKMESIKNNFLMHARRCWKLSDAAYAILMMHSTETMNVSELAQLTKKIKLDLKQPRPIEEAISSAGGIACSEIDANMMLQTLPGCFVAGEMIDWEAPTGGYLMQGCFITATKAAQGCMEWLKKANL